jgi:hypothetical protein
MRTRQDILKILDRAEPISEETQTQDLFLEENKPTKPDLWSRAKSAAKKKFNVYPSAYANGWAVKWYNSHGGGWNKVKEGKKTFSQLKNELEEDLGDWFKEKWVDIGGKKDPKTGKYPHVDAAILRRASIQNAVLFARSTRIHQQLLQP